MKSKSQALAPAPPQPAAATRPARAGHAWQHSPRLIAQRQRIAATFGPAGQLPAAAGAVLQRVPVGHYVTTADAHLRDKAKNVLAEVKSGTPAVALAPLQTLNFSLGLFSFAKDHTWMQCQGRQGWLRDGVLAASQAPPQPAIVAPSALSAPSAQIAISGAKPRRRVRADSSDDAVPASSLPAAPDRFPPIAKLDVDEAKAKRFAGFHVYLHFTKPEYRQGIHETGLQPGAKQGIGLPDDSGIGPPDADNVYVLSGSVPATTSAVSSEAGGAAVAVVSRGAAPDRDANYPKGGAYRFGRGIGPGRGYDGTGAAASISLVLPLSPSGKAGLAEFLNEGTAAYAAPITAAEAEVLLARHLFKTYPIHFLSYEGA